MSILANSSVSLARHLLPEHSARGHFVSRFSLVPISIRWKDVSGSDSGPASGRDKDRKRLIAALGKVKEQYAEYLSNPCTPQLMAEQMRLAPPKEGMPMPNPYVSTCTNLGNVEALLPVLWPTPSTDGQAVASSTPLLRVSAIHFGHRLTLPTPCVCLLFSFLCAFGMVDRMLVMCTG